MANDNDGVTTSLTNATTAAKTWAISDVELMLEYVELISYASRTISQQKGRGYAISFDTFANYASTVAAGENAKIWFPARYSSIKTLLSIFRLHTDLNKTDAKTISTCAIPITGKGQC